MVASFVKAVGAIVVGAPVAVLLGLTARSVAKQEDAAVPVVVASESPIVITVFSNWLDKRSHEHLAPTSFKPGYSAYDLRVENRSGQSVRGVRVELVETDGSVIGATKIGEVAAKGSSVFTANKPWKRALDADRSQPTPTLRAVVTWRGPSGRLRAALPLPMRRVLGEKPADIRRRHREKAIITGHVMS